jgi:hypothetical protein
MAFLYVELLSAATDGRLIIGNDDKNDFNCEYTIGHDTATFVFKDEAKFHDGQFTWNNNPMSAIEFSWLVYFDKEYVNRKGDIYEGFDFGARYFSQRKPTKIGDLKGLLSESEISGFAYKNIEFFPIYYDEDIFDAKIVGRDLVFILKRDKSTSFFFDDPPTQAHFWTMNDINYARKCLANINETSETGSE